MKILKTFGRDEYVLEDREAEGLERLLVNGAVGFIKLKSGDLVNVSSIEALRSVPLVPRYNGYVVAKDGIHFIENGERIVMSNPDQIEYVPDPKYQKLSGQKLIE